MNINWDCKAYGNLTVDELYAILKLRIQVFVVEQKCIFQDCDNNDQESFHLCGWQNDELVAYARVMPPGLTYDEASIGRVVNSSTVRGKNVGRELMKMALKNLKELFGDVPVKIGAQLYLKRFYESFGFVQTGNTYDEDGIDHIKMLLQ